MLRKHFITKKLGNINTKSIVKKLEKFVSFKGFMCSSEVPTNEIWYTAPNILDTSSDKVNVNPYEEGNELVSHTYENGKGILKYKNTLYTLPLEFLDTGLGEITSYTAPNTILYIKKAFYDVLFKNFYISENIKELHPTILISDAFGNEIDITEAPSIFFDHVSDKYTTFVSDFAFGQTNTIYSACKAYFLKERYPFLETNPNYNPIESIFERGYVSAAFSGKTFRFTYYIYTNNEYIKTCAESFLDEYTITYVYHLDGEPWES